VGVSYSAAFILTYNSCQSHCSRTENSPTRYI